MKCSFLKTHKVFMTICKTAKEGTSQRTAGLSATPYIHRWLQYQHRTGVLSLWLWSEYTRIIKQASLDKILFRYRNFNRKFNAVEWPILRFEFLIIILF